MVKTLWIGIYHLKFNPHSSEYVHMYFPHSILELEDIFILPMRKWWLLHNLSHQRVRAEAALAEDITTSHLDYCNGLLFPTHLPSQCHSDL